MQPIVDVLLPVRNGEAWIQKCLESLQQQTYSNFEVLFIDDSSTDNSLSIARRILGGKLRVVRSHGTGLADALAFGVRQSRQEIICRMDVDDLAEPTRLARQVEFLTHNPDYVLVGSNVRLINMEGLVKGRSHFPLTDSAIRLRMTISNPFAHSAVAFRRMAVLEAGNYRSPSNSPFPEDYDLWTRLACQGHLANLPETLLSYRINTFGVMQSNAPQIRKHTATIATTCIRKYNRESVLSVEQVESWWNYIYGVERISMLQAIRVLSLMLSARLSTSQKLWDRGYRFHYYLSPLFRTLTRRPRMNKS